MCGLGGGGGVGNPQNDTWKQAGTEIFHSNGQTETGFEMVFITLIFSNYLLTWMKKKMKKNDFYLAKSDFNTQEKKGKKVLKRQTM